MVSLVALTRFGKVSAQIDDSILQVLFEITREWTTSSGKRRVMRCSDMELMVILQQKRPVAGVKLGCMRSWLDHRSSRRLDHGRAVLGLTLLF